jgi:NAD(P)-dependent dehydrogenase (short-subunit alcohol dehydrogenase family)
MSAEHAVRDDLLVIIGVGAMGMSVARRMGSGRVVALADIDERLLEDAAERLAIDGHRVLKKAVDVTSHESVAELAAFVADAGRVVHLVHTAGLSPSQASAAAILAVDLLGVALVLEEFEQVIAPGGSAVVIASMSAHIFPPPDAAVEAQLATTPADVLLSLPACVEAATTGPLAYPFAKRANVIRVAAAAKSWGRRGARINSISPGIISTAMGRLELDSENGDMMRAMVTSSGSKRLGTPDDIGAAAELLLGPLAAFITGIDLLVDGGVMAAMRTGGFEVAD